MTRLKWIVSAVVLVALVSASGFFLARDRPAISVSKPNVHRTESSGSASPLGVPQKNPDTATKSFRDEEPMKRIMDLYERESRRVGKIDSDPKGTEKRLEESARELTDEELRWLESQAVDIRNDADARFFAAYLMGLSHRQASVVALGRIALLPLPASKNPRIIEQERAFRASAVEGLSLKIGRAHV